MIGILTFHRSHNYGSVLQSYALQKWLGIHNWNSEIIDLYTNESMKLYKIFPSITTFKSIFWDLIYLYHYRELKSKWTKFKKFQDNVLILSHKQYHSFNDLNNDKLMYTTYLTGSDQIWNTICPDFNWAYYLEFATYGNFISYAPSFGPLGKYEQHLDHKRIARNILRYSSVSVRDDGSAEFVEEITHQRPEVTVDPTLLLTKKDWESLMAEHEDPEFYSKLPKKYIFFYSLKRKPIDYNVIQKVKDTYHLPVVITDIKRKSDLKMDFVRTLDAGPVDFLSLVKHAELVVTSSFHGTVFSLLFEKKFFSINGMKDNRISNLLLGTGLEAQSIDESTKLPPLGNINIDYDSAKEKLEKMTIHSEEFLQNALMEEKHGNL
jgi:hypothetical protein